MILCVLLPAPALHCLALIPALEHNLVLRSACLPAAVRTCFLLSFFLSVECNPSNTWTLLLITGKRSALSEPIHNCGRASDLRFLVLGRKRSTKIEIGSPLFSYCYPVDRLYGVTQSSIVHHLPRALNVAPHIDFHQRAHRSPRQTFLGLVFGWDLWLLRR